jgi:hypothetical protein
MRAPDAWHLMSVLKELTREIAECKQLITTLQDDMKTYGANGGARIQFMFGPDGGNDPMDDDEEEESEETDSDESAYSAQSAPPTVSYERESQ